MSHHGDHSDKATGNMITAMGDHSTSYEYHIIALVTGMATFTVLYSDHGSRKEVDYGSNQRKHDNSYG